MTYVYDLLGVANGSVLLFVLILLLLGPFRKFPSIMAYVVWELSATAVLTVVDLEYPGASQSARWYARLYWGNEVIVDLLQFLLVIVLTYRAARHRAGVRSRGHFVAGRVLAIVLAATLVLPFLLFHPTFRPWPRAAWFNSTSELLNFGAAIMNFVLWGTLIATRQRDLQLVSVSAGLGVVVTGAAISYGLRHLLPQAAWPAPNLFLMLTQLGGWGIWCWALWPAAWSRHAPRNAVPSPAQ